MRGVAGRLFSPASIAPLIVQPAAQAHACAAGLLCYSAAYGWWQDRRRASRLRLGRCGAHRREREMGVRPIVVMWRRSADFGWCEIQDCCVADLRLLLAMNRKPYSRDLSDAEYGMIRKSSHSLVRSSAPARASRRGSAGQGQPRLGTRPWRVRYATCW